MVRSEERKEGLDRRRHHHQDHNMVHPVVPNNQAAASTAARPTAREGSITNETENAPQGQWHPAAMHFFRPPTGNTITAANMKFMNERGIGLVGGVAAQAAQLPEDNTITAANIFMNERGTRLGGAAAQATTNSGENISPQPPKVTRTRVVKGPVPDYTQEEKDQLSPFNPSEKCWKSQDEFLDEAKQHLGKTFGIYRLPVDKTEGNNNPQTNEAFPRMRSSYLCGSCKRKERDLPHTTQGCCGFYMKTVVKKNDAGELALVVTEIVLPRTSLHWTDDKPAPSPVAVEDGIIRKKGDLSPDQIQFVEDEAKKNTDVVEIRRLVAKKWPSDKIWAKLIGILVRNAKDAAGIARKPPPQPFQVCDELRPKVSPFNPNETKWYSYDEFHSQLKSHMAESFGITNLPKLDCEKNKDKGTMTEFPYCRLVFGCGSCRQRVKEMPKDKWGCCGFSIRTTLVRGNKNDKPHIAIREFVLTTNSVHAGYVHEPEEVDTAPKRLEKDLTDDQISILKCFGRRRTDTNTVMAIFKDAFNGMELTRPLVYRVMKKGRSETNNSNNDEKEGTSDNDEGNDKEAKKERFEKCAALGRQIAALAREYPEIYSAVMPELTKLVNKCVPMGNESQNKRKSIDSDGSEDEYNAMVYNEWVSENPPSKKAKKHSLGNV
jgi:hypothetical protein